MAWFSFRRSSDFSRFRLRRLGFAANSRLEMHNQSFSDLGLGSWLWRLACSTRKE
jgi:hypothetical protein